MRFGRCCGQECPRSEVETFLAGSCFDAYHTRSRNMDNWGNYNTLFASLFWGSIGFGCAIYGKKQAAMVPLFGGVVMMALSYFISSALYMSLVSAGLLVAMIWLRKLG